MTVCGWWGAGFTTYMFASVHVTTFPHILASLLRGTSQEILVHFERLLQQPPNSPGGAAEGGGGNSSHDSKRVKELMRKYDEQRQLNARLLTKMQAVQGNIQVCCRIRPPTAYELRPP